MEMRFQKVNNRRFKGFKVSIIMGHEKFPTFAFWNKVVFFVFRFLEMSMYLVRCFNM
jgi:hypothetical protein